MALMQAMVFGQAAGAHEVAGRGLGGAHRRCAFAAAEHGLDRQRFGLVAERRGCAVRVDIANVGRLHAGPLERQLHAAGSAFAVRAGRGNVVCIRGIRVTGEYGVDFCAAGECMLLGLDQESAAAFTDNEAVAVKVERAARLLGGRRFGGKAPWPATDRKRRSGTECFRRRLPEPRLPRRSGAASLRS